MKMNETKSTGEPKVRLSAVVNKPSVEALRSSESTVEVIYERIIQAVLEHRLYPGTKLGEDRLATIFKVSRARIREVLAKLSHEGIVDLFPQRGAFVARPTIERARHVFEARRLIEPGIVRRLIDTMTPEKLERLREHHRRETDARSRGDQRAVIRLSGEFHTLMAQLAGNGVLEKTMRELSALTCLVIFLYDIPKQESCREDEHDGIIELIAKREVGNALRAIEHHLDHIEASLKLDDNNDEVDLEALFSSDPP